MSNISTQFKLGHSVSNEIREKISKANKGNYHSKETKLKISKSMIGREISQEWRNKISKTRLEKKEKLGYLNSPETRQKISNTLKGRIPWNKGLHTEGHCISEETKKKIGEANKGKKFSQEHKNKLSQSHKSSLLGRGEKHHNWQGGISKEPYSFSFDKQLKELIRNRDNYKCQLCGMPEIENIRKLDIHHIDYDKKNCLPNNLISLCRRCHIKTNFKREYWIEYFNSIIYRCYSTFPIVIIFTFC